jgi:hypothetical protein
VAWHGGNRRAVSGGTSHGCRRRREVVLADAAAHGGGSGGLNPFLQDLGQRCRSDAAADVPPGACCVADWGRNGPGWYQAELAIMDIRALALGPDLVSFGPDSG